MEVTARDIEVQFSMFIGVNNATLGGIQHGSIIHLENIFPCALGLVDDASITQVDLSVGEVEAPTLSGFLDGWGTDHLVTTIANAMYGMYEQVLIQAFPSFFARSLKDMLNDILQDTINKADACPKPDSSLASLVDYRDLLLPEENAVELKGRRGSPYGQLFRIIYSFMDNMLSSVDEKGMSRLNAVITLMLGLDSNQEGEIILAQEIISQSMDIDLNGIKANIELEVSDVSVSNIDSLGALKLLQPIMGESSVLDNEASLGVGAHPISLSLRLKVVGKRATRLTSTMKLSSRLVFRT